MPRRASSWASVEPNTVPRIVTETIPGPRSRELDARGRRHMMGYSNQVTLCPVVFEKGKEIEVLADTDIAKRLDALCGVGKRQHAKRRQWEKVEEKIGVLARVAENLRRDA